MASANVNNIRTCGRIYELVPGVVDVVVVGGGAEVVVNA